MAEKLFPLHPSCHISPFPLFQRKDWRKLFKVEEEKKPKSLFVLAKCYLMQPNLKSDDPLQNFYALKRHCFSKF